MDYVNKSNVYATVKEKSAKTNSHVLLVFCSLVCCIMFLFSILLVPKMVKGSSMYPTINAYSDSSSYDVVYILKQYNYGCGDIVVLKKNETQSQSDVIKRIVAMGGDKVSILMDSDGFYKVYVNDVALNEPYIASKQDMQVCYANFRAYLSQSGATKNYLVLGVDEIFVLGDNRANSLDSSNYGPRKLSEIEGRVVLVVPQKNKLAFKIIW